jgi:hypothetical protein
MSRVPLASRHPPSVVVETASSSLRVSSGMSYRPSRDFGAPQENSNEAAARRASVVAPPQHTNPKEGSARKADEGATSRKLGHNQPNRGDARRSLNYSTKSSQTQDSQKLIAKLRREIHDLRQEARGQIPTKERPTKKTHASKRQNPEYPTQTRSSRNEDFSETSSSQSESRSLTPPTVPRKSMNLREHSRSRPPLYGGKNSQTKKHSSRKTSRPRGQNAVWKALNLISSSPSPEK